MGKEITKSKGKKYFWFMEYDRKYYIGNKKIKKNMEGIYCCYVYKYESEEAYNKYWEEDNYEAPEEGRFEFWVDEDYEPFICPDNIYDNYEAPGSVETMEFTGTLKELMDSVKIKKEHIEFYDDTLKSML